VAGRRLHGNRVHVRVGTVAPRSTATHGHLVGHRVLVVQRHLARVAFAEAENAWRGHGERREDVLGDAPVNLAAAARSPRGVRGPRYAQTRPPRSWVG